MTRPLSWRGGRRNAPGDGRRQQGGRRHPRAVQAPPPLIHSTPAPTEKSSLAGTLEWGWVILEYIPVQVYILIIHPHKPHYRAPVCCCRCYLNQKAIGWCCSHPVPFVGDGIVTPDIWRRCHNRGPGRQQPLHIYC